MSNITTGRQLRVARILAGLTQKQLAHAVGVHERAARYWELKEDKAPTSTPAFLEKIEAVLRDHGVIIFSTATAGVRLASNCRSEGNSEAKNKIGQRRESNICRASRLSDDTLRERRARRALSAPRQHMGLKP